jgi:hypothetical protein
LRVSTEPSDGFLPMAGGGAARSFSASTPSRSARLDDPHRLPRSSRNLNPPDHAPRGDHHPGRQAVTEPPHYVEPGAIAREALDALATPGVTHLLVAPFAGAVPQGVVAPFDLIDLLTRP